MRIPVYLRVLRQGYDGPGQGVKVEAMQIVREGGVCWAPEDVEVTVKADHGVSVAARRGWWWTAQYVLCRYTDPPEHNKHWFQSMNTVSLRYSKFEVSTIWYYTYSVHQQDR